MGDLFRPYYCEAYWGAHCGTYWEAHWQVYWGAYRGSSWGSCWEACWWAFGGGLWGGVLGGPFPYRLKATVLLLSKARKRPQRVTQTLQLPKSNAMWACYLVQYCHSTTNLFQLKFRAGQRLTAFLQLLFCDPLPSAEVSSLLHVIRQSLVSRSGGRPWRTRRWSLRLEASPPFSSHKGRLSRPPMRAGGLRSERAIAQICLIWGWHRTLHWHRPIGQLVSASDLLLDGNTSGVGALL